MQLQLVLIERLDTIVWLFYQLWMAFTSTSGSCDIEFSWSGSNGFQLVHAAIKWSKYDFEPWLYGHTLVSFFDGVRWNLCLGLFQKHWNGSIGKNGCAQLFLLSFSLGIKILFCQNWFTNFSCVIILYNSGLQDKVI